MSVAALTWAFHIPLADPAAKAVLAALADHADTDGRCWPAIPRLQLYTGLSPRGVHGALMRVEALGLVTVVRMHGRVNEYYLNIGGSIKTSAPPAPPQEMRQRTKRANQRTSCATTSAPAAPSSAPAAPEPSVTVIEPSREPSVPRAARQGDRGTRLDPGWLPSDADRAFAAKAGLNPDVVAEEFRDYWIGCPGARGRKADWPATFRNWCRKNAERSKPRASGQNGHAAKPAFRNGWAELVHTRFLADGIDGDGHDPQDVAPAASGDPIDAGSGGVLAARPRRAH